MAKKKNNASRILIVEDDALLLSVLSNTFKKAGFEIATVENGLEVEEAVKKISPNLILLDLIIPGIDGFEVLKRLKASDTSKEIPVIILSNLEDVGDVKSGRALGADEYFIKANIEVEKIVDYVKKKIEV
ncbi:response regulator [Candidatus Uhrbacteria bacterium]|nr:response regulator [Candidatus Uhrbacteria bacterium]